jgi:hypothetical protein
MMDNASALPTYPTATTTTTEAARRFTIGLKAPTRLHDEANLILALALVAIGGGLFYFYFLTATPDGWMALAAGIVGRRAILAMG